MSKWVRTPHLPWSGTIAEDDLKFHRPIELEKMSLVVTEKLDGECTTMTRNKVHARSEDSKDHPSRHLVKQLHGEIGWRIPDGMSIIGENTTAVHSIFYPDMEDFFYVFAVVLDGRVVSLAETLMVCRMLDLRHVPILAIGDMSMAYLMQMFSTEPCPSAFGPVREGFVVRSVEGFDLENADDNMAKYVRPNHVQTDEHWMNKPMVRNGRG